MKNKICTKCKIEKSTDDFYKDDTRKDGYGYWCRQCCKTTGSLSRKIKREKSLKRCKRCGIEKTRDSFDLKSLGKCKYVQIMDICRECCKSLKEHQLLKRREWQRLFRERNIDLVRNGKRRSYEKNAAKFKIKRDELKSKAIGLKGGVCSRCGLILGNENPSYCFDFHHPDPSVKKKEPGALLQLAVMAVNGEGRIKEFFLEASKCDVLCAVCHRKVHYEMGEIVNM